MEESERRGVFGEYLKNRQRPGVISKKVTMNNRFMDMDYLEGKELTSSFEAKRNEKIAPKTNLASVASKKPARLNVLFTQNIGITSLAKLQEKSDTPLKGDIEEEDLKSSGSSNEEKASDDSADLIEDAMDDLD